MGKVQSGRLRPPGKKMSGVIRRKNYKLNIEAIGRGGEEKIGRTERET